MKLAGTITTIDAGIAEIRLARRDVRSVVRFRGSFAVPVDFRSGEDLLQDMSTDQNLHTSLLIH